ncbi:MAG: RNA 2',3'-cyclic phosphodiesterase [Pseudomonadota bacterium]
METLRTFIALELPEQVKEKLARLQQKFMDSTSGVRWVKPDNIHLTLKFLGSTRVKKVEEVSMILDRIAQGVSPFVLNVGGIGAFPNPKNPKVIWAGIQANACCAHFQERLETALAAAGFSREDRPFSPHLTIGRLKDGRMRKELGSLLEEFSNEHIGRFEASHVVFFRSDLEPAGPVYARIKDIELVAKK